MFPAKTLCRINSRKFDGSIHRTWQAELIEHQIKHQDELLIFVGEFDREINHTHLGVIRRGTVSYEFYWLNRGYNVYRFHEPDGALRNFYCNLNLPPTFENNTLDYVDLDLDVLLWKDFSYEILDRDEYEENARLYNYSDEIRGAVDENLRTLLFLIEEKLFPFDYKF